MAGLREVGEVGVRWGGGIGKTSRRDEKEFAGQMCA